MSLRTWFRDWLNKPTPEEQAKQDALHREIEFLAEMSRRSDVRTLAGLRSESRGGSE
jgi:hypothetical protein